MKSWNYWPYITVGFLAVAFFMTGTTIYIAVTKVPVELDGRFQMSYQDMNENYLDFQNQRDDFDASGNKIQITLPTSLENSSFQFQLIGPDTPTKASLVISRPATNQHQIGPFELQSENGLYKKEINLGLPGCWVFDLKFKVKDQTIFERHSLFFDDAGTLQKMRTCGRK